jgi:hypothetical protein
MKAPPAKRTARRRWFISKDKSPTHWVGPFFDKNEATQFGVQLFCSQAYSPHFFYVRCFRESTDNLWAFALEEPKRGRKPKNSPKYKILTRAYAGVWIPLYKATKILIQEYAGG